MCKRSKISRNKILAFAALLLLLFFINRIHAADSHSLFALSSYTNNGNDTIITDSALLKLRNDTGDLRKYDTVSPPKSTVINAPDSLFFKDTANADTTRKQKIDSLLISKDSLDAPIDYSADDSGVLFIASRKFYLYGKANAKNKDVDLTANNIQYDQSLQVIKAFGGIDTAKNPLSKPTLVQGDQKSISDTIEFNLKSQRGLSKNSFYNEGEIFVNAERVKKVNKDVAFAYRSRFTTCNLDTPHFAFVARRMKLINNKIAVSGPAHPEFEGVPIPIYIPFGIYPLNRGRHSGLLPPQFTNNSSYGLGLEGLGYYKVVNDNWDVTTRGNIYSYGGWTMTVSPEYYKRYKYRGNLNLEIQHTKVLNNTSYGFSKDEFTRTQSFSIRWSHSQDTKAHPGTTFQASVNAGSTRFNQYVPDNPIRNYQNQLTSSISYSKTWKQSNLTVALNHNQNNNLHLQNISFPTVSYTVNTIYPFEKKEQIGTPKWYEKLGISYNGQLLNQFSFYDTAFKFKHILDTVQWGVQHSIPISIALPALGPFIVSPYVSYSERWFGQLSDIQWDEKNFKVDTSVHKGFYAAREVSFGASVNTRIFGTLNFPKSKNIVAIRHEVKPTISFSYKPDLVSQFYRNINISRVGTTTTNGVTLPDTSSYLQKVSLLGNNILSPYSSGKFGGLTFSLENLLEMKVKNKKDSTGDKPTRKVKLIDGLNFSTSYNLLADSLNWSNIAATFRTTLFQKINITGNANIDPYQTNQFGQDINKLMWRQGKIGRLTNASFAVSTSIQSKTKDGKTDDQRTSELDETLTPDEQAAALAYVRSNPADFVDFDIPWSLSLSFTTNFSRLLKTDYSGYYTQVNSSLNLNGDFSLTPKWKIGGSTYFNVRDANIGLLTMYITREMHCWQLAINLTPVGRTRSFSIVINPKSALLRDLRINRSRSFTTYP